MHFNAWYFWSITPLFQLWHKFISSFKFQISNKPEGGKESMPVNIPGLRLVFPFSCSFFIQNIDINKFV